MFSLVDREKKPAKIEKKKLEPAKFGHCAT